MSDSKNLTILILREIRDEIRKSNERLESVDQRLESVDQRLGRVEEGVAQLGDGMLELAEQQRFVVRYLRANATRDHRIEAQLAELRSRVEALEARRD